MILKTIFLLLIACFAIGTAYVRMVQIPAKHFAPRAADATVGAKTMPGGHRVVMPVPTADELNRLISAITATPRTVEVDTNLPDTRIFVHRSYAWGFPDVTHVTLTDELLILDSHLVYGQSDLGVNRKRIDGWLSVLS